jgi:hypothetical protein
MIGFLNRKDGYMLGQEKGDGQEATKAIKYSLSARHAEMRIVKIPTILYITNSHTTNYSNLPCYEEVLE